MKPDTTGNKEGLNKSNTNRPGIIGSILGSTLKNLFRSDNAKDSARLWLTLEADLKKALENLWHGSIVKMASSTFWCYSTH
jgi:hypothetical protein